MEIERQEIVDQLHGRNADDVADRAEQELPAQVDTDEPTALLHQLTSGALARGVPLRDLSVTRPPLEDVYLELTAEPGA